MSVATCNIRHSLPMPTPSHQRGHALRLLAARGIMRLAELRGEGVGAPTVSRLVEAGLIVRTSRGLYELPGAEIGAAHSLAEMAKRVPRGVICLVSALQFHEITVQSPRSVWVAIGNKDRRPKVAHVSAHFLRFGAEALTRGVEVHSIDGVDVKIFDAAKTVVDCFRFRRRVGLDVALEALRLALHTGKARPDAIAEHAKALRIWSVLRPYLESAVANDA